MDINLNMNVTINAPELCASLDKLAAAIATKPQVINFADINTGKGEPAADKSNFTFKLPDTTAADETSEKVENTTDKSEQTEKIETVDNKPETTETANDNPAQDTGEADNKPATEETTKPEVQKVEREVICKVLKAKVDAGKKAQVRAFLDTYGVGISLPNIPEDLVNTEMLAKAEAI